MPTICVITRTDSSAKQTGKVIERRKSRFTRNLGSSLSMLGYVLRSYLTACLIFKTVHEYEKWFLYAISSLQIWAQSLSLLSVDMFMTRILCRHWSNLQGISMNSWIYQQQSGISALYAWAQTKNIAKSAINPRMIQYFNHTLCF